MILARKFPFFLALVLAVSVPLATAQDKEQDQRFVEVEQLYRQEGALEALPEFERLLGIFSESEDTANVALTLGYIGECHWRLGNFDEARSYLDRALVLKQELGDRHQQGKTLNVLGLLEWDLGNFDQAIRVFVNANAIGRETGDRKLEGATLNNLSMVYDELGDYQTSLDQYKKVLEIYSGIDFPRGVGDTLGNIGGVHLLLGHYAESVDYYLRALEISTQLKSVPAMSQDHGNLGLAYTGLGQVDTALKHFDQALLFSEQAGMEQEQGLWLRGKANAQIQEGRYDLGLENHRAALTIYAETGARTLLLEALHDMGQLHLTLGDLNSARQYFEQAIGIARAIESSRGITINLLALGDLQYGSGQYKNAADLYAQALQRAAQAGEQNLQAESLLRLGQVHLDMQSFEAAQKESAEALILASETQALAQEITALYLLAELERLRGNPGSALDGYSNAIKRSEGLPDPNLLWQIEYGRALAYVADGKKRAAVEALNASISHIESIRNRLRENRFRTGYLQDKRQVYLELARLQLELGENAAAFTTAERLRTWSYREHSAQIPVDGRLTDEQKQVEVELRERIRHLQRVLEEENNKAPANRRQPAVRSFSQELILAEREYQTLLDDKQGHREPAGSSNPEQHPAVLRPKLKPSEALIEYLVGPDSVMIFVLTSNELRAVSVPVNRSDLHSRLELLRDLINEPGNGRWRKPAASLARILIDPVVSNGWLLGIDHLYLVPHEILNYLPFSLLLSDGEGDLQPLLDNYFLTFLPSASVLAVNNGMKQNISLLAAVPGRSRLKYAPEEAEAITQMFKPNARLISGASATESTFKEVAGDYEVLHLATHGHFNRFNPLLSGLELEPDDEDDGLLEVHEILGMELNSDLVTLSACETGMGSGYLSDLPAGDEFVSLTRAFLQAGSASVLATLWEVDDRSTVNLMKDFYRRLQEPGAYYDKAVALADAQRALRSSETYGHPYYWAPYVLVGNANRADRGGNEEVAR